MHKHEQCSSNIILVETLGSTVFPIFHFTRKLKGISHSESVRVQHDAVLAGEVQMLAPSNDTLSILAYDLGHGRLPLSHHAHLLPFSISLAHLTLTSVSTIATVCLCKKKIKTNRQSRLQRWYERKAYIPSVKCVSCYTIYASITHSCLCECVRVQ